MIGCLSRAPLEPQVGGWRVGEEGAHPTKKLLMIRARGEVAEPGEEEPGGVGGEEDGGGGDKMPRRG